MTERYEFFEDQTTYIREQLMESIDGAAETYKDISAAAFSVYFRAFTTPQGLVLNTALSKVTTGSTGKVEGYIKFLDGYNRVLCRIILADSGTADTATLSGQREYCWIEWEQRVRESPQPTPTPTPSPSPTPTPTP